MTQLRAREYVRDFLNDSLKEIEIMNIFDLDYCSKCNKVTLIEDMEYIDNECFCIDCIAEIKEN